MKKILLSLAALALTSTAFAGEVIETLTVDLFSGISKATTYADVTYTSPLTGITYQGNMASTKFTDGKPDGGLQFRSSGSKEGLVMTANPKGAIFKSLKVTNLNTTAARTIDVYGKTTAYTGPTASQLYATTGNDAQGTKVGGAAVLDNATVTAEAGSNYTFIGFRSNNGACYLAKVEITYEIAGEQGKKAADLVFSETSFTVKLGEAFTAPTLTKATNADVVYSTSDAEVADVVAATGVVTIKGIGTATITAKTSENDEYYAGEATYTINVLDPNIFYTNSCMTEDCGFEATATSEQNPWKIDTRFGLVANGRINSTNYDTDAYMVSPVIDMTNRKDCSMTFDHAVNFFNPITVATEYIEVVAREEGATTWTKLNDPTLPESASWTFHPAGTFSLAAFDGKKIQIGFHYKSTPTVCGAWEIQNINIKGTDTGVGIVDAIADDVNAPVRYYNLQGVEVANPADGLFIRVQGKKATKVIIRK